MSVPSRVLADFNTYFLLSAEVIVLVKYVLVQAPTKVFPNLHNPMISYISTYKSFSNTFCPVYYLIEPFPLGSLLSLLCKSSHSLFSSP